MTDTQQSLMALKTLSDQVRELELRLEERLKSQHGRFNIFTTLLPAHDEVRLHTRFLHELLNPNGSHDCGDLFLKLFLKTLNEHNALEHDGAASQLDWKQYEEPCRWAGKEVSTEQGQLDLLLKFESRQLIIENKICAGEQDRQVARYIDYLNGQQGHVLYLTLDGKAATTHEDKPYLRISYREHITAWIECCLQSTYNIVPINQTLIQYQRLIKQLTGQSVEQKHMKSITQFIRTNPDIISNRQTVNNAIDLLRVEVLEEFAEALMVRLSDEFIVRLRPDLKEQSFGVDSFGDIIIRSQENDFTASHPFQVWIEHISKWTALVIGIESNWNKPELSKEEQALLERMREKMLAHSKETGMHHAEDVKTWAGTHWPVSWHDLIQEFLANDTELSKMLSPEYFQQQVDVAANGVREYMALLSKFYHEAKQ
ncbi:MAG: PD-(D/E)XK nuclease family protein [Opitutaceae bacterium]